MIQRMLEFIAAVYLLSALHLLRRTWPRLVVV
jgi:hypothetical protein